MRHFLTLTTLLLAPLAALRAAEALVVEKTEGAVTATEIQAFKSFMREVVDGTLNPKGHGPGGLGGKWMGLSEFAPELLPILYEMNRGASNPAPRPQRPFYGNDIAWRR